MITKCVVSEYDKVCCVGVLSEVDSKVSCVVVMEFIEGGSLHHELENVRVSTIFVSAVVEPK